MEIPEGAVPLLVGTVLALGALSVVLSPLISDKGAAEPTLPPLPTLESREGTAIAALREIEFDKATGKLSDKDYESLRAEYTREALTELRAADNAEVVRSTRGVAVTDDIVEAAIRRAKEKTQSCVVCGPDLKLMQCFVRVVADIWRGLVGNVERRLNWWARDSVLGVARV